MLTQESLKELLSYDPETGEWFWLKCPRASFVRKSAGWIDAYGYRRVKINGHTYICSRLAFLYMTGEMPKEEVDHIDRDPGNDRWANLREADRTGNCQNRSMRRDNISGVIGVFWNSQRGKWQVQVNKIHIGLFTDLEEAKAARLAAVQLMHGDFAVLNPPMEIAS